MKILLQFAVFSCFILTVACGRNEEAPPVTAASPPPPPSPPPPAPVLVSAIAAYITLHCHDNSSSATEGAPVETLDPSTTHTATVVGLEQGNQAIRFIDDLAAPPATKRSADGSATITIAYSPEDPNQVIGRPVTSLSAIEELRTRYDAVLRAMGFTLDPGTSIEFELYINGLRAVAVNLDPTQGHPTDDGFTAMNVAAMFVRAVMRLANQY